MRRGRGSYDPNMFNLTKLVEWVNSTLKTRCRTIGDLFQSNIYCLLLDAAFPGKVNVRKVRWEPLSEAHHLENLRVLQDALAVVGVPQRVMFDDLVKGRYQTCLELIKLLRRQFSDHADPDTPYDALARRKACKSNAAPRRRRKGSRRSGNNGGRTRGGTGTQATVTHGRDSPRSAATLPETSTSGRQGSITGTGAGAGVAGAGSSIAPPRHGTHSSGATPAYRAPLLPDGQPRSTAGHSTGHAQYTGGRQQPYVPMYGAEPQQQQQQQQAQHHGVPHIHHPRTHRQHYSSPMEQLLAHHPQIKPRNAFAKEMLALGLSSLAKELKCGPARGAPLRKPHGAAAAWGPNASPRDELIGSSVDVLVHDHAPATTRSAASHLQPAHGAHHPPPLQLSALPSFASMQPHDHTAIVPQESFRYGGNGRMIRRPESLTHMEQTQQSSAPGPASFYVAPPVLAANRAPAGAGYGAGGGYAPVGAQPAQAVQPGGRGGAYGADPAFDLKLYKPPPAVQAPPPYQQPSAVPPQHRYGPGGAHGAGGYGGAAVPMQQQQYPTSAGGGHAHGAAPVVHTGGWQHHHSQQQHQAPAARHAPAQRGPRGQPQAPVHYAPHMAPRGPGGAAAGPQSQSQQQQQQQQQQQLASAGLGNTLSQMETDEMALMGDLNSLDARLAELKPAAAAGAAAGAARKQHKGKGAAGAGAGAGRRRTRRA